jgi:DNA-binding LacI/PurR family transcriptional regulator
VSEIQDKRATLHDVAELAGVSYQTVSRVVNHHPNVADETRKKVLRAIRQMGYRPNQVAKVLATGRSYMIQLIIFDLRYSDPLPAMLYWVKQHGYTLVITEISPFASKDDICATLEELTARMIDGLVMFTPYLALTYEDMVKTCRSVPFVLVSNELGIKAPSVVFDQRHGTKLAIQHLFDLGHRQIAEISGPMIHIDARLRHETFVSMMESKGLEPGPSVEGDFEVPSGYAAANKLLNLHESFTAIFVANDRMALGALHALHEHGLRVPDDISIVSFDDMVEAAYFNPPLTTIRQDMNDLAHQSIEYLVSVIENPNTPIQQRVLYPELVLRESTRRLELP